MSSVASASSVIACVTSCTVAPCPAVLRLPNSFMSIVAPVTAAASAPSPPRAAMATRLRWLARVLAGLVVAAWSLLLLAWLTLHWGILPHIAQWRPEIEARASRVLGVPVQIGTIGVRSGGWMPTVELHG